MNFRAGTPNSPYHEDNWNYEKITKNDDVDSTKEFVTGDKLRLIQNYPVGKFCVESIFYSCGKQLFYMPSERSVNLDVETIRKAWFKKGNPRMLEVDWNRNCIWFSNMNDNSVRAIDINPSAFTECNNTDQNCISNHIEVF